MFLLAAAADTAADPTPWWVPWLSVTGAVFLFFLGILLGPWGKSREALFLEERHTRRRFQQVARDTMRGLLGDFTKYSPQVRHFTHGRRITAWQELLKEDEYKLGGSDRAIVRRFNAAMYLVEHSKDEGAFTDAMNELYDRYLDLQRPVWRWRRRHAARRDFFEELPRPVFPKPDPDFDVDMGDAS